MPLASLPGWLMAPNVTLPMPQVYLLASTTALEWPSVLQLNISFTISGQHGLQAQTWPHPHPTAFTSFSDADVDSAKSTTGFELLMGGGAAYVDCCYYTICFGPSPLLFTCSLFVLRLCMPLFLFRHAGWHSYLFKNDGTACPLRVLLTPIVP